MPVVDDSIIINRPRDQVFAYAVDPTNVPLYSSSLIEFKQVTPGPVQKGTRNEGAIKVAGKRIDFTNEVVEFEEGRHWLARTIDSPFPVDLEVTYEDVESGTKVTWHEEAEGLGSFFGKLADPLVARMRAKDVRSNLAQLKELLEAE